MRVIVTGGSGKAGRTVCMDLLHAGHEVLNVDLVPSPNSYHHPADAPVPFLRTDLTDLGQTIEALRGGEVLSGVDAVVHLAAIPAPGLAPSVHTLHVNTTSTFNVFHAAASLGVGRVIWASSETTLGLPFDLAPDFVPVDEAHVRPESTYALSKVLGEEMARYVSRQSGMPILGLRLSNVMIAEDYARFATWQDDPQLRRFNLWGYVDEHHVGEAVRRALEVELHGADAVIIAAPDTVMHTPSADLMRTVFPDVELRRVLEGNETLLNITKARELLGYAPQSTWRDAAGPQ